MRQKDPADVPGIEAQPQNAVEQQVFGTGEAGIDEDQSFIRPDQMNADPTVPDVVEIVRDPERFNGSCRRGRIILGMLYSRGLGPVLLNFFIPFHIISPFCFDEVPGKSFSAGKRYKTLIATCLNSCITNIIRFLCFVYIEII